MRKVKCDEGKPSCQRCIKTGRRCDGYTVASGSSLSRTVGASRSPRTLPELDSPEALRAFDFYRSRSIALLGGIAGGPGVTRGAGFDAAELWGGPVIQLAISQPAVRHALLALSSLHERVSMPRSVRALHGGGGTAFAYAEYGKAITAVRSWGTATAEPAVVPLLVCILFICIEFLGSYEDAALVHILQGRQILSRLNPDDPSPAMDLVRRVLAPMYARLSLTSFTFGMRPERIPEGFTHIRPGAGGRQAEVPLVFETLKEARDSMFWLVDEGLRLSTSGKPAVFNPATDPEEMRMLVDWQEWLLGQLRRWDAAFTVLKTTLPMDMNGGVGERTTRALQDLLLMYYHTSVVWASTALTPHEAAYDNYTPSFSAIVSHASSVIAASSSAQDSSVAFTFESEIIPPVFWAATKCRHPLLRRAALRLLGRAEVKHRREGLWRANVSYAVAKKVTEIEEEGMAATFQHELDAGTYVTDVDGTPQPYISIMTPPTLIRPPLDPFDDTIPIGEINVNRFTVVSNLSLRSSPSSSNGSTTGQSPARTQRDGEDAKIGLLLSGRQGIDPAFLVSPYGVPEHRRIKNTVLPQHQVANGGLWITTFMSPQLGETVWDTRKLWVKI